MYFVPQKHKCPKCDFEMEYSKDYNPHCTPVTHKGPICPKCYENWLIENLPVMEKI